MSDATGKQSLQVGTVKDCLTDRLLDVVPDLEGDYAVIQEAADEIQSLRARVCDEMNKFFDVASANASACAAAIRARGEV